MEGDEGVWEANLGRSLVFGLFCVIQCCMTILKFFRLETEWTMRNAELFTMKIWGTRSDLSWGRTERILIQDVEQWLVLKHILRRLWTELSFVIHTKYYFAFCFIVAAVGKKNTWLTVNIQMSFTELILEHSQGCEETQVEKFKAELFSDKN